MVETVHFSYSIALSHHFKGTCELINCNQRTVSIQTHVVIIAILTFLPGVLHVIKTKTSLSEPFFTCKLLKGAV